MMRILSTNSSKMSRNSEKSSSSSFLVHADETPLEELDPAILCCGLPAIILSETQPMYAPPIRYSISQLQTIRKSSICSRRPVVADDPKVALFAIWRTPSQPHRRGKPYAVNSEKNNAAGDNNGKGKTQDQAVKQKHPSGRENGFIGPRFRRNYEFSNSNHHVIVKSYRADGENYQLHNSVIEEEPEWVSGGPTSRLDTIELRGFDDDLFNHGLSISQSSSEKADGDAKSPIKTSSKKHISFYDELHHYEHVTNVKRSNVFPKPHDSSSRENDVESVTTSNTSSPPPARSTPMKHSDFNNLVTDAQKHNGVNMNNFEEFMKFDSLLGYDSAPGSSVPSGSRFSKWFRRGNNSFNPSLGSNYDTRRHPFHLTQDNFASGYNNRYPFDRNFPQQYQPRFSSSYNNGSVDSQNFSPPADSNSAFKRVIDMITQNRAQQQYLLQMLNKNQQSEILCRMLMRNTVDNASDASQQQQQQQPSQPPPRIPTQLELQLHTQSIMQNALLRKKLQDQRKMFHEQNSLMATASNNAEANPEVQQFVKSVSPNIQRSLSVLSQTATGAGHYRLFNQSFPGANAGDNNSQYNGGLNQPDLSASLRQILLPQQQQGSPPLGNRRRLDKRSVTWKHPNST